MKTSKNKRMFRNGAPGFAALMVLFLCIAPLSARAPYGVVVYKPNPAVRSHLAFEYVSVRPGGQVYDFINTIGKPVRLLSSQMVACIPYPAPASGNIVDEAPLRTMIREYENIKKRYPVTGRFVDPKIKLLDKYIQRIAGGEVFVNGAWISKQQYERLYNSSGSVSRPKRKNPSNSSKQRLELRRKIENVCHKD